MGLAASQGRYLALTARNSDLVYEAQQISQQRLALATETQTIADEYTEAMNNTVMMANLADGSQRLTYDIITSKDPFSGLNMRIVDLNGNIVVPPYQSSINISYIDENGEEVTEKITSPSDFANKYMSEDIQIEEMGSWSLEELEEYYNQNYTTSGVVVTYDSGLDSSIKNENERYLFDEKCKDPEYLQDMLTSGEWSLQQVDAENEDEWTNVEWQGTTSISEVYDTADSLIQKTQIAARYIDKKFNHTISVYDRALQLEEQRLKGHEQRMRSALENGEFKLYLQGQFDLRDQSIARAEALVRWELPDGTIIYPDQFIALFEQNGFSTELDFYMFEQACKTVRNWIDNGYEPIAISVNQTRTLLSYPHYVHRLKEILDLYEVPARYLMIEMLEGEMATHIEQLNDVVDELHKVGIRMALDDFGTGYSSLNVLAGMSLDEIKFDKEFLLESDPEKKEKNKLILKQMFALIKMFNIRTVVEGVEDAEDVDFLKHESVDLAQGFYFSRPIPTNRFEELYLIKSKIV